MPQFTPNAINAHVGDPTNRSALVAESAILKGIMTNLDAYRFIGNMIESETVPKGELRIKRLRFGNLGSEMHRLGTEILPQDQNIKQYYIYMDERPRVTSTAFDDWEDFITNIPHQQAAADRMGYELHLQEEAEALKLPILASRVAAVSEFLGGGIDNNGTAADMGASGATNAAKAATFIGLLDNIDKHWHDIKSNDPRRIAIIDSDIWYAMRDLNDAVYGAYPLFHRDVTGNQNGMITPLDFAGPDAALVYKGFQIYRTQIEGEVFGQNRSNDLYRPGDFSNTAGVVFKPDCCAMIRAKMPSFETERSVTRQTQQAVASQLLGGGSWYSENAIELAYTS